MKKENSVEKVQAVANEKKSMWERIGNLHPLSIVFLITLVISFATYLIPGGEFERREVIVEELGGEIRALIVPGTFQYAASVPQGIREIWTYFMEGAVSAADVSFSILLCAGAFCAIIATGAVDNGIQAIAKKFGKHTYMAIPICVFAFGLGGATYGMYEDAIPFILVLVPMFLSMGYDSMVGLMTVHFSVAVGASAAFMNPFCVGIGQALAQVPMLSGIGVRIICWLIMMTAVSAYILRYAFRIKKDPTCSPCYEQEVLKRQTETQNDNFGKLSVRNCIVLILLAAGMGIMVYGVIAKGWWFYEIGSVFLIMGIGIPLAGGLRVTDMIEKNIEGMTTVIPAVLLISASRVLSMILEKSNTLDTILYFLSSGMTNMPKAVSVSAMYGVSSLAMLFVQSSSGLAAILMPIMAPLADLLGISRQTAVSAFALGSGAFGWIVPWEGVNYAMCVLAGVPFFKYLKQAAGFVFKIYIPLCIAMLLAMLVIKF